MYHAVNINTLDFTMQMPTWITEEHEMLLDMATKFNQAELVPLMEKWRKQGHADRDFWLKVGETGVLGAGLPEKYGGSGGDFSHDAMVCLAQALVGDAAWGWGVHNMCLHYISSYGTEAMKDRVLPKYVTGEYIGAIAMSEPGAGSDLQGIKTTAIKDGDEYVINGSKIFITNGQLTNAFMLVAKTDPSEGSKGVSLFLIETEGLEGFERGANLEKIGMKGQDTSELFFQDVRVPASALIGEQEGQGFYQLMNQLPWERLVIAIGGLGACYCALDHTLTYVKERKAFGKRIMDFQNTQFKLAELKAKIETARPFVWECIEKVAKGELDAATASMAKLTLTELQGEVMDECLQLHGGYGYMMEYPVANLYVDARVQRIYGGTNEIMKLLIARSLDD